MVKFSNAILTDLGEQMLAKATVERPINFTHLLFSSDSISHDDIKGLTEINSKQNIPISQVELKNNNVEIKALFSNKDVKEGYYLHAIGLYANDEGNDILIAVSIEDSGECYIESDNTPIGAIIQMFLKIEDTQIVNLTINPLGSASLLDIKNIKDFMNTHIKDKNNPHNITKELLGLDNVENVSVDNQQPMFSQAASRENIASGEKMSTILGKIRKWFSDLKTVAFTGSYNDLANKPSIPSVGNGTVTITQNGSYKGSFTMNQSGETTIALTDTNTDTNTWRPVQDNLSSTSTTDSLSANMGRELANGSARDNTKMLVSGGTFNGIVTFYLPGNEGGEVHFSSDVAANNYVVDVCDSCLRIFTSSVAHGPFTINGNTGHFGSGWIFDGSYSNESSGGVTSLRGDVQVQNGLWYKVGRMVVFSIHYYVSAEEIGAGTNIITGLPNPLSGYWYGLSGGGVDTYAIVNGVLSSQNNRGRGEYRISGSYIC